MTKTGAPFLGVSLARPATAAAILGAGVVWLLLLGPVITLMGHLSWTSVLSSLRAPGALQPLLVSVEASLIAVGVIILAGTPLAWMLARDRLPLTRVWEGALLLPLLTPPLVIGLLLVFMVGPATPAGALLAHLHLTAADTFFALVVAEVYEAVPYYVLGAEAAFAAVDPSLERAASLLGDSAPRTWRRITLPLAAPGLASALAVTWARAMGAFGAVLIIAYHPFGLPLQIWTTLQETGLYSALPFALILLLVALPLPLAAYFWSARARRRL